MILYLKDLWGCIAKPRRTQLFALLILMIVTSIAEVFSIGAVLPFLAVLTAPEQVLNIKYLVKLMQMFDIASDEMLKIFTVVFSISAIVAGAMRILLLWLNTRLSFLIGADLSIEIFKRTLSQPYSVHCTRNSSEVIDGITGKTNAVIYSVILPILTLVSSLIILSFILCGLILIHPVVALTSFISFGFVYLVLIVVTRDAVSKNSLSIANRSTELIKQLQEGLGAIRDILIDGLQEYFCKSYQKVDSDLRVSQASSIFISVFPRYMVETLGMLVIAALAYWLVSNQTETVGAIPILGTLALGAQRILPILQQAYSSFVQIMGAKSSLNEALIFLKQPLQVECDSEVVQFNSEITLEKIDFYHKSGEHYLIHDLNVCIKKGDRIGFIGATGSGKSTLLDLIMCLHEPINGLLKIDGVVINEKNRRSWQKLIAHVPQTIYLSDATIEENIAFGIPVALIESERVKDVAKKVKMHDLICSWTDGYKTLVGERGVRLSGGQRQRLGIARALYKKASVIILDEATNALDSQTEDVVMEAINNLDENLTILMIAHRVQTLSKCTAILEMSDGKIIHRWNYDTLIRHQ